MSTMVQRIAVIGAGMAGAACAQRLAQAGHAVHVFDKARGPGGRMATRRASWQLAGERMTTRLDHGALGLSARTPAFRACLQRGLQAGQVALWTPLLAAASLPLDDDGPLYLPVPDMPALCRQLLQGVTSSWACGVDGLQRNALGWQVMAAGQRQGAAFDQVVLALPPAQAAALLAPVHGDWARHAALVPMQACWTLMGVAAEPEALASPGWDLCRPAAGPLAWVMRSDARPGRERVPGQAHWVAHARPAWSQEHLEQDPAWVEQQLQAALAAALGRPLQWLYSTAHRWRYAQPQGQQPATASPAFWWDAAQGLGVCGDFVGGDGVEGAWLSGRALAAALLQHAGAVRPADAPQACCASAS